MRLHFRVTELVQCSLFAGLQRENFSGGMKVDTGPPNLIGPPKPDRGPMPLNHFLPMVVDLHLKVRD